MTQPGANVGTRLIEAINSKDAQRFITEIQQFKANMRDVTVGADYVTWITEPVNLTVVQKAIAEDLGVPPRAMAIKRLLMSRPQKAALLVQAMELAVKRVHKL
jgi:hypothetical protein